MDSGMMQFALGFALGSVLVFVWKLWQDAMRVRWAKRWLKAAREEEQSELESRLWKAATSENSVIRGDARRLRGRTKTANFTPLNWGGEWRRR